MTGDHIEVVREARTWLDEHEVNHGPEFQSPKVFKEAERFAQAVLSLEAELAECHEWIRNETAGHDEEARKLEAELAQVREERDALKQHLDRTARSLVAEQVRATDWREAWERMRDRVVLYREALERIAWLQPDVSGAGGVQSDLARVALTRETEPRIRAYPDEIEGGAEADAHTFHANPDGTIYDAVPVGNGASVTVEHVPACPTCGSKYRRGGGLHRAEGPCSDPWHTGEAP